MSTDIKTIELLIKCGRIIWDLTEGDESRTIFIQKISEKLEISENETREILRLGEDLGLVKASTSNQVSLGPFANTYFSRNIK